MCSGVLAGSGPGTGASEPPEHVAWLNGCALCRRLSTASGGQETSSPASLRSQGRKCFYSGSDFLKRPTWGSGCPRAQPAAGPRHPRPRSLGPFAPMVRAVVSRRPGGGGGAVEPHGLASRLQQVPSAKGQPHAVGSRGAQTKGPAGPTALAPSLTLPDGALAPHLSPVWPLREAGARARRLGSLAGSRGPRKKG